MKPPLDLSNPETLTELGWAREKARCEKDFLYLAERYLRIKSKEVIGFPTLRLRRVQQILWGKILDQWKRTGWVRQIWGKARQTGASTLTRGFSFQQTAFNDHRNAFLLTHDEPTSYKLFDMDKIFYDNLPPELQPLKKYDPKNKMTFSGRNSEVVVGHARNFHVGASQMNHFVHMTEVARYPNAEEVQASLFPTFSSAKGEDCSVVIIESTSRFGGKWFKDFAEAAMKGESAFEFTFIPAHLHEPYNPPLSPNFRLTLDEKEIKRKHGVSDNFLSWRRDEMREYKNNPAFFTQEFALSWDESWILPQGTLRMFKDEYLIPLQSGLRPGKRMTPTSTGLVEQLGGPVEVWEAPESGVYYDLGVDISEGRTESADWSVGVVIRRDTLKQVARYRLHINPASVEYVDLNYWLGMAYNAAQINPDITGGWGNYLLSELQVRSYPNIWHWRRRDDAHERVSTRLGFYFTRRDKSILVSTAVALVERGETEICSENLFEELRAYLNVAIDEWSAAPGSYDDECCAWMLALLAARDERYGMDMTPVKREEPVVKKPWSQHDVDADLSGGTAPEGLVLSPWRV